jgi:hypothetical protein
MSDASSALPSVCSSTRQGSIYRRVDCGVDSLTEVVLHPHWGKMSSGGAGVVWMRGGDALCCASPYVILEQVQGVGASNCLGAALDAQFAIDVVDVAFHRADGDDEHLCHSGIRQTRHQQP